jgi:hypothetical protein
MKSSPCFAAYSDNKLRSMRDKDAHDELVRRGLVYDPSMKKGRVSKKIPSYKF